jgi:hypothetical protein
MRVEMKDAFSTISLQKWEKETGNRVDEGEGVRCEVRAAGGRRR